jgi:soluble lytic murein transglycosylase
MQRLLNWTFLLLFSLCGLCGAATLHEDSARFASFWAKLETGDTAGAREYLLNLGGEGKERTGALAGFLLAWQAYLTGDWGDVPPLLDSALPPELADYALWLKADALDHAGQSAVADGLWTVLAQDTTSVLWGDAEAHVAGRVVQAGQLAIYDSLAARLRALPNASEAVQSLAMQAAEALAAQQRHAEAVDRLYEAYLYAPQAKSADLVLQTVRAFQTRYGFAPRSLTLDERKREFAALDKANAFAVGLRRVEDMAPTTNAERSVRDFYRGRFLSGLGRHGEAIAVLRRCVQDSMLITFRGAANLHLGRSAYLVDQDSLAIPALTTAASCADTAVAGKALELLGILYLDRHRPAEAVVALRRWLTLATGTDREDDCLWRLGWADWEANRARDAADCWMRLSALDGADDYGPTALYWSGHAAAKAGAWLEGATRLGDLFARYPFSYYAAISKVTLDSSRFEDHPLNVPSLDHLWVSGGLHARKFALLAALRLPELALKEWPAAVHEMSEDDGFQWWKAQLFIWQNDRLAAYRVILTELGSYLRSAGVRPTEFYRVAYPLDFDPQIADLAREQHVDPYFVFAVICQESHFDSRAVSAAGAVGLMQLMPATARKEAAKLGVAYSYAKLHDPDYNLRLGISHLAGLLADFGGDTVLTLAAYNAGKAVTNEWYGEFGVRPRDEFVELIPYRETRLFVKRIIEHRAAYRRLYPDAAAGANVPPDSSRTHELH